MTYWQSPHFKAMQQAWYAELRASGFEDAEELVGGEMVLKQCAEHVYRTARATSIGMRRNYLSGPSISSEFGIGQYTACSNVLIEAKENYFRLLSANVKDGDFRCKTDRIILLLRAEGAKIKQIMDTLSFLGRRRCRTTVEVTIMKYEREWGLRQELPQWLSRKTQRIA